MYAIVDVETTGLSPVFDRIIEIAVVIYDGQQAVDTYSTLVNPEVRLAPNITRLTGITNELLQDAPKFYEIARKIVELTESAVIVAHNARFDYSFLRQSFRRLGYNFHRRQLCTVRLSRKHFPGLPSYSLGNLCRSLNISIENKHRAMGDAMATLTLFQKLQTHSSKDDSKVSLIDESKETFLPPGVNREDIAGLPEETGVYYFHDARDRLVYVGKSKNIRKRILGHFSGDLKSHRSQEMKERIRRIHYEVTGSELIALLLESEMIKKHQPPFNRDQRNTLYLYGVFCAAGANNYLRLSLGRLKNGSQPLLSFTNKMEAMEFLDRLVMKFGLCQKLCGIHKTKGPCFYYHTKRCAGACIGQETAANYNRRVETAIRQFDYVFPSFLIIGKGRQENERSVVSVENGVFQGFGYFNPELAGNDISNVKAAVQLREDNQDVRRIIISYLRKNPQDRVIRN